MNISLNAHPERYQVGMIDLYLCSLTLCTAISFAIRHLQQAHKPREAKWGHYILAFVECMPILGAIVALIEYCVYSRRIFHHDGPLFQGAHLVTQFQQLPQPEQQCLEKAAFKMLKARASEVHSPHELSGTGEFSNFYFKYCDMTQNCSPEEFVKNLERDKNSRGSVKPWWAEDYSCDSALHWAVRSGRVELIRHVLNCLEEEGQLFFLDEGSYGLLNTPLLTAITTDLVSPRANREEIVELLLDAQANPNLSNEYDKTPLFVASERGYSALIQRLLLHPTATLSFRGCDEPIPRLSKEGCAALLMIYRQIEGTLQEGLQLVLAHTDVHPIIAGYYWRG